MSYMQGMYSSSIQYKAMVAACNCMELRTHISVHLNAKSLPTVHQTVTVKLQSELLIEQ